MNSWLISLRSEEVRYLSAFSNILIIPDGRQIVISDNGNVNIMIFIVLHYYFAGTGIKFGLEICINISKQVTGAQAVRPFQTRVTPLLLTDDPRAALKSHYNKLVGRIEKLLRDGSGWAVDLVTSVSIYMSK